MMGVSSQPLTACFAKTLLVDIPPNWPSVNDADANTAAAMRLPSRSVPRTSVSRGDWWSKPATIAIAAPSNVAGHPNKARAGMVITGESRSSPAGSR